MKLAESKSVPGLKVAVKIVKKSGVKHKPEMLTNEVRFLLEKCVLNRARIDYLGRDFI